MSNYPVQGIREAPTREVSKLPDVLQTGHDARLKGFSCGSGWPGPWHPDAGFREVRLEGLSAGLPGFGTVSACLPSNHGRRDATHLRHTRQDAAGADPSGTALPGLVEWMCWSRFFMSRLRRGPCKGSRGACAEKTWLTIVACPLYLSAANASLVSRVVAA